MTDKQIKRRVFLKVSVAGSALAFPGASLLAARSLSVMPPEGLQELFGDESRIRMLGEMYLSDNSEERGIGVLQSLTVSVNNPALATAATRRDFELGNVVTVDGWVLSRTEARHCALFSILTTTAS